MKRVRFPTPYLTELIMRNLWMDGPSTIRDMEDCFPGRPVRATLAHLFRNGRIDKRKEYSLGQTSRVIYSEKQRQDTK